MRMNTDEECSLIVVCNGLRGSEWRNRCSNKGEVQCSLSLYSSQSDIACWSTRRVDGKVGGAKREAIMEDDQEETGGGLALFKEEVEVGGQLGTIVRERQELEISSIRSDLEVYREDERDSDKEKQCEDVGSKDKKRLENKDSQRAGEAGQRSRIHVTEGDEGCDEDDTKKKVKKMTGATKTESRSKKKISRD